MIRDNKAALIQSAEEFVQIMGWAVAEQLPGQKVSSVISSRN